jgi:hypothetical protein
MGLYFNWTENVNIIATVLSNISTVKTLQLHLQRLGFLYPVALIYPKKFLDETDIKCIMATDSDIFTWSQFYLGGEWTSIVSGQLNLYLFKEKMDAITFAKTWSNIFNG